MATDDDEDDDAPQECGGFGGTRIGRYPSNTAHSISSKNPLHFPFSGQMGTVKYEPSGLSGGRLAFNASKYWVSSFCTVAVLEVTCPSFKGKFPALKSEFTTTDSNGRTALISLTIIVSAATPFFFIRLPSGRA